MTKALLTSMLFLSITMAAQDNGGAQETLPDAPERIEVIQAGLPSTGFSSNAHFVPPTFFIGPRMGKRWRTFDGQFVILHTLSTIAVFADIETTIHGLNVNPHAHEINPLLGPRPSPARVYATVLSWHLFGTYESYRAKRDAPRRSVWKFQPRVSIIAHSLAAVSNLFISSGAPRSPNSKR